MDCARSWSDRTVVQINHACNIYIQLQHFSTESFTYTQLSHFFTFIRDQITALVQPFSMEKFNQLGRRNRIIQCHGINEVEEVSWIEQVVEQWANVFVKHRMQDLEKYDFFYFTTMKRVWVFFSVEARQHRFCTLRSWWLCWKTVWESWLIRYKWFLYETP